MFCVKNIIELLKYVKYIRGSYLMENLWAKDIVEDIVDSTSTALLSFLHSDLTFYVYSIWSIFTR